jgi:streptogramin lyase
MKRILCLFILGGLLLNEVVEGAWMIRSLAGNGAPGMKGDFGSAKFAQLDNPLGITRGPDNSIWICEAGAHRIRQIRADGVISTFAGNGKKNFSGDLGPAAEAALSSPYEVQFDAKGDLYIADTGNHAIRKVDMKTLVIKTIAGTGFGGYSGDGDLANIAHLKQPSSIKFGPDGNLYISDMGNHAIRKMDLQTGRITTVAGTGEPGVTPDGGLLKEAPLRSPRCIAFDKDGNLWATTLEGHQIYKIDLSAGKIFIAAGTGIRGFSGNGGPARAAAFSGPKCLALDGDGNVWISDTENNAIRKINAKTGNVELVAGTGERGDGPEGPPLECKLSRVHGLFVDKDGSVFVADSGTHRIRVLGNEEPKVAATPTMKERFDKEMAVKAEAARQAEQPVVAEAVAKQEALNREETSARLEEALKLEDVAKREAILALEENIARKTRLMDQRDLELAKREQFLTRQAQEHKMQAMGLRQKERLLKELEAKEVDLAKRERLLGSRKWKDKISEPALLEKQVGLKRKELSKREQDLERKAQELKLLELERKEQLLATRERDMKRRADDLRIQELERKEQQLAWREQEIARKKQMLKLWEIEWGEKALELREKAIANRERLLKVRTLEREEEDLARREKEVERRAKELVLRDLERAEEELAKREREVERRTQELIQQNTSRNPAPAPGLPPQRTKLEAPVAYPLRPAKEEVRRGERPPNPSF